jgi:Uncharacterized protein conserved in bacteria
MALYAFEYRYDEDLLALVNDIRPAHRTFMRELEAKGVLIASGFLRDATFNGALAILRADSAADARKMLSDDPFAINGLIHSIIVREWQPTIGAYAEEFDTDFPHS